MKEQSKKFSTSETIILVIMSLLIGFVLGDILTSSNSKNYNKSNDKYLQELIDNYEYVIDNYYEEINKQDLVNGAISGMMESLDDPYSMYFNENETDNFSITLKGSYSGIGVQIGKEEDTGYMLISTVFKNSSAANAGIKVGDKVVSIDGTSVVDLTIKEFGDIVKNSDKTEFELEILRDKKTLKIKVKKNEVTLNSVTSETYKRGNKKIGYIYIGIFAKNTYEQFKNELEKLESENIDSLIIDVRSNTGGYLTAVDSILDLFLNSNQIMYKFDQNGKITTTYGHGDESKKYEIVLLGDSISASASEVLIAGLKENLNSKLIGEKTYGKGTVQELVKLSDGTQYKITIKKWLTPLGNWINDTKGIEPDIEVKLDSKYYETYEDEDDNQLQKALEYLESI